MGLGLVAKESPGMITAPIGIELSTSQGVFPYVVIFDILNSYLTCT